MNSIQLNNALETFGVNCPYCGMPLLRPKQISRITGQKMAGACGNPECPAYNRDATGNVMNGYKQPFTEKGIKHSKTAEELQRTGRRADATNYYLSYSVRSNDTIITKDLHNYRTDTSQQGHLLHLGKILANRIAKKETVHGLIYGPAGIGKSHIANGVLVSAMKLSDYRLKALFIDWRELLDLIKLGMNDDNRDIKQRADRIRSQIKIADVVVLDDMGSERVTQYNADAVDGVIRNREDKSLIITSNLDGAGLRGKYGERVMSRITKHSQGNSILITDMPDYRKNEVTL